MTLNPRNRSHRRAAFTLMEVLVVVAILVVLAGIGIGVFYYLDTAKEKVAQSQIKNLEVAIESYRLLNDGQYPDDLNTLLEPINGKPAPLSVEQITDPWQRPYKIDLQTRNPRTDKPLIYSEGANPGSSLPIRNWHQ
jgi:general secretion pathway protein G